jgi:hypothetical protein
VIVERSIAVCQVLLVVTVFDVSVFRRTIHGRRLLDKVLGEIPKPKKKRRAD